MNYKNQKGQALLFVLVAVTLALSVGISVSTRNISSAKRVSRTDTSTRVYAAAEGGLERALVLSDGELNAMSQDTPTCPTGFTLVPRTQTSSSGPLPFGLDPTKGGCSIEFESEDGINSKAIVYVTTFNRNSDSINEYWFNVGDGAVKEVKLTGYTGGSVNICWVNRNTAIHHLVYSNATYNNIFRGGAYHSTFTNAANVSGFNVVSSGSGEYVGCSTVSTNYTGVQGLRIHALFEPSKISVRPATNYNLPIQGWRIKSIGQLVENSEVVDSKVVEVYKSFSYLPSFFDFNIYSVGTIN